MRTMCRHLADDQFAYLQLPGLTGVSNCGILRDGRRALLIDTLMVPAMQRGLHAALDRLGIDHVHTILHTHGHIDHVGGDAEFSDAVTWTTPAAAAQIQQLPAHRATCAEFMPTWADEIAALPIRLADHCFDATHPTTFTIGRHTVQAIPLGHAHSDGDVAIYCETTGVLFTGDLVFAGLTPLLLPGGSATGWLHAIDRLRALRPQTVVPGHGPIGDARLLDTTHRYWETLLTFAHHAHTNGLPFDAAMTQLPRCDPAWRAPERHAINLFTIYWTLDGHPTPPPLDRLRQLWRPVRDTEPRIERDERTAIDWSMPMTRMTARGIV